MSKKSEIEQLKNENGKLKCRIKELEDELFRYKRNELYNKTVVEH